MVEGMRRLRLLTWAACVGLVFVGSALAQSSVEDDVFWESVSGCTDAVEVKLYIEEFGEEGRHVAEARACLEKLRKAVPDTAGKKAPSTEIERLLEVCEMHFTANRLTTGVGGTAVQCYREVQSLDPANRQAVKGLQRVFGKYVAWARAAIEKENVAKARGHVEKLKGLAPEAPEVAELEEAIARLERQVAEAREQEREEDEQVDVEQRDGVAREKIFVSIGTGIPIGVFLVVGKSVCRMVHKGAAEDRKHGIRCAATSTRGSTYNIGQISQGDLDFGVVQSDWQYHSYNCSSHKVTCLKKLRAVFSVYPEAFHIIVGENSGIRSWDDLKGKRVNIGNPGSGQRLMMEALMKARGTNRGDFAQATELFSYESVEALCDGKIDAFGYVSSVPATIATEAADRCNARIIDLNSTAEKQLVNDNSYYAFATIPKGTYKTTTSDVTTFGLMATFVTSTDVPEEVVYEVTRAVFENLDEFKRLHPSFANLDPRKMVKDALSAPLHQGAVRYYREKGLM